MAGSPHGDVERGRCAGMGQSGASVPPGAAGALGGLWALHCADLWHGCCGCVCSCGTKGARLTKHLGHKCPGSDSGHGMGPWAATQHPLPTCGSEVFESSQRLCTRLSSVRVIPAVLVLLLGSAGPCGVMWNLFPSPGCLWGSAELSEARNPVLCSRGPNPGAATYGRGRRDAAVQEG